MILKELAKGTVAAVAATVCLGAAEAACTFDFSAASERMYGGTSGGGDLLAGAEWHHNARMSTYDIKRSDPRWQAVVAGVRKSSGNGEYVTENSADILRGLKGNEREAAIAISSWQTYVNLPDAEGGRYRFSYLYAMNHTLGHAGLSMVIYFKDGKTLKAEPYYLANIDSGEFSFCRTLSVPKGVNRICLDNRIQGLGKLRFWNATLRKLPPEKPVVLHQAAVGWYSETYEVPQGQSGLVCWHWKRGFGTAAEDIRGLSCVLTVPKGFTLEGVCFGKLPKDPVTLPDGAREYRFAPAGWLAPKAAFDNWHRLGATVTSAADVGTRGTLRLRVLAKDGSPLGDEAVTELVVARSVHAPRPKRFVSGMELGGWYWETDGNRGVELLAQLCGDAGFAGVFSHGVNRERAAIFRKAGVGEVLQGSATLCNGFCIGPEKGRPEEDKYVFLKPGHHLASRAACPLSVSEERDFFRTVTVPWLEGQVGGSDADALWTNWEPYSFAGCGCMCGKCRAAFARYVGVSDEEMAKDWPQELAFGGKWHDRIARFRSIEHGKLVKTISKHANVVFGIFWGEMSSAWRPRNLASEVQAIDYADSVKTMCPWGPYPCWQTEGAYAKKDAICLESFCAAKDVRAQVDKDYPKDRRPRLMALPSGCSFGCDWVGQPEWLFLQTVSFFLNGWESSYMAGFPRGYDARYWRAMALANKVAAKYEDYVYDGVRCDGKVKLASKKPFKTVTNVSSYLDWTRDGIPVVQAVAYRLNGKTMVAVLNFSEEEAYDVDVTCDGRTVERGLHLAAPSLVVREI